MVIISVDTSLYTNNACWQSTTTISVNDMVPNVVYVTYQQLPIDIKPTPKSVKSKNKKYTKTPFLDQQSYYEPRERVKRIQANTRQKDLPVLIPHKILWGDRRRSSLN